MLQKNAFNVDLRHQQQQNIYRSLSEVPDIFFQFYLNLELPNSYP